MKTALSALVGLLIAGAGSAQASTINYSDLPSGGSSVGLDIDGVHIDVAASVRTFKPKTVNGITGMGIAAGAVDAEVDNLEAITFTFSKPVFVDAFSLAHLYTDGNFGDVVDESALVTTDAGNFILEAVGATTATWNGLGAASNISPGNNSGGGAWLVSIDPLAGTGLFAQAITSLSFSSGEVGNASKADFSFMNLQFSVPDVPAPATIPAMLALGAAGLRRRRATTKG